MMESTKKVCEIIDKRIKEKEKDNRYYFYIPPFVWGVVVLLFLLFGFEGG